MKALKLAVAIAITLLSPSAVANNPQRNPIKLEGQIREIAGAEDGVTIRLHRDRYPIVTGSVTRVRWLDGRRAEAGELRNGDSIRVEGDLQGNVIYAERITILLRIERPGGGGK